MTEQNLLRIKDFFNTYRDTILPLVALIEVETQKFPVPILNEARAFLAHVANCFDRDDGICNGVDHLDEVNKAHGHIVRMQLDCFKALNIIGFDYVKNFLYEARHIDLALIDDGMFYPEFKKIRHKASKQLHEAKLKEIMDREAACLLYEIAFNSYFQIIELIEKNSLSVHRLRSRFRWSVAIKIFLFFLAAFISGIISTFFSVTIREFCHSLGYFIINIFN